MTFACSDLPASVKTRSLNLLQQSFYPEINPKRHLAILTVCGELRVVIFFQWYRHLWCFDVINNSGYWEKTVSLMRTTQTAVLILVRTTAVHCLYKTTMESVRTGDIHGRLPCLTVTLCVGVGCQHKGKVNLGNVSLFSWRFRRVGWGNYLFSWYFCRDTWNSWQSFITTRALTGPWWHWSSW